MVFPDLVDFSHTTFTQEAFFAGAIFTQEASFTGATFIQRANFTGATFTQRVYFARTTFTQTANFSHTTFMSEANFQEARFTGEIWLRGSRFHGRVLFTGRLEDGQTVPIFSEAQAVDFRDVVFGASDVIFRHADLRTCRFLNTDLRQVSLADITWARTGQRQCLYDEIAPLTPEGTLPWGQLEQLYRQLKRNYEEQRDYERAGHFHYGEKEMRRKNPKTSLGHRFLLWLYWLISGYGERIWKPLVAAGFVLVAFMLVYLCYRLTPTKPSTSIHPLALNNIVTWGEALVYSFRVMTLQKPQDFVLSGSLIKLIYTLQSFIGPLLIGLLALAVRQRLKR
jgi:hypothetical protein